MTPSPFSMSVRSPRATCPDPQKHYESILDVPGLRGKQPASHLPMLAQALIRITGGLGSQIFSKTPVIPAVRSFSIFISTSFLACRGISSDTDGTPGNTKPARARHCRGGSSTH